MEYSKKRGVLRPKKAQETSRQHYIPCCYLKSWQIKPNYLYYSKADNGKYGLFQEENYRKNLAVIPKLYTLSSELIKERMWLEDVFNCEETAIAPILDKIRSNKGQTKAELVKLAEFVIRLRIRNPDIINRQTSLEGIQETKSILIRESFQNGIGLNTARLILTDNFVHNFNLCAVGMCNLFNSKAFQDRLANRKIYLMKTTKSNYSLLTSNYPLIYRDNLFTKNIDYVCPVTPSTALFIVDKKLSEYKFKELINSHTIDSFVTNVNICTLSNYVYSNFPYEIYSNTNDLAEILPTDLTSKYFKV